MSNDTTKPKIYTPRLMRREAVCIECGCRWHPIKSSMNRPPRCHSCDSRQTVWLDEHPELMDPVIEEYKVHEDVPEKDIIDEDFDAEEFNDDAVYLPEPVHGTPPEVKSADVKYTAETSDGKKIEEKSAGTPSSENSVMSVGGLILLLGVAAGMIFVCRYVLKTVPVPPASHLRNSDGKKSSVSSVTCNPEQKNNHAEIRFPAPVIRKPFGDWVV